MKGMASDKNLDAAGVASTTRAVDSFTAPLRNLPPRGLNATLHMDSLLEQAEAVKATFQHAVSHALSGAASVEQNIGRQFHHTQRVLRARTTVLGVYTKTAQVSRQRQREVWNH